MLLVVVAVAAEFKIEFPNYFRLKVRSVGQASVVSCLFTLPIDWLFG